MDSDDELDRDTFQSPPKRRKLAAYLPSRNSMSDLLAQWGALKSPTSVSRMQRQAAGGHELRGGKQAVSYAESPPSSPGAVSNYESAQEGFEPATEDDHDDQEEDSEDELLDDSIQVMPRRNQATAQPPPPPKGRELPARSTRNIAYMGRSPRKVVSGRASRFRFESDTSPKKKKKKTAADRSKAKAETARNLARQDIALHTKPKRDAFLLANKDYFLPLLPPNNYIVKLERAAIDPQPNEIEYRSLTQQPEGVTAVMKPYQLDGLSFLVHMHKNGMSSILGDEMGLGKTLQTLALFSYLAQHHPIAGEHRPNLVVCPLSVLSSWMAETRKWTPDLNVVRFHGPKAERERFKATHKSGNKAARVDVLVTTYETFSSEQTWFKHAFVWRYCVLDEGHKIKNEQTG